MQHRRHQARQVVLQQIVAGAVAHRLDGGVLADLAGQQDERDQPAALLQQLQRHQAGEARQVEVREDHVPRLEQRIAVLGLALHAPHDAGDAAAPQVGQRQFVIQFRILDVQYAQRHRAAGGGHGPKYRRSPRALWPPGAELDLDLPRHRLNK